ncbi:Tm-1-like ATP-binding domain-containing protein [Petroclostridium sp. X23]|uniref:Tm-1-like ATP-binding domain-containing protein n=1 Tax=Petroclostridium sp. X23 TaxID=3045146 RepID=UPI0024AD2E84|nr:Tm-1-like ATP-binding domain-containing protein [Petroclostridium sp. X23]WHH57122.1 Tm-1-like ATP-binding domain-containing protein [Petroclostridium sp. X23]
MNKKPNIICTGILNTKFTEIKFLAEQVKKYGGNPIVMDLSLGKEVGWADISLDEVLASTGTQKEDVFAAPRSTAIEMVGKAGEIKIQELYNEGKVDGIISWAGSVGTTTVTHVMRALPFGVPKIMLTDMASSDVSMWLGNKDIYIVNPTAEQGINVVTRKMVANAAAAVVAMAKTGDVSGESRPLAAITAYGTTTPTVKRCTEYMESRGWDTIIIHQVGTGATMEDLIRSGQITAIIDLTTGELTNNMYNSPYAVPKTWEGKRLTAASDMGIPQIVVPGGLDQSACGPLSSIPQKYLDDFKTGKRRPYKDTQLPYKHNEGVTIMVPTLEEIEELSLYMAGCLNSTKGPTVVMIPMCGWSAYDQSKELATNERGWAKGNGDGPVWEPDDQNDRWSRRATLMRKVLNEHLNKDSDNLDLIICDMHILDEEFADLCNRCMGDMLDKTWKKGMYTDIPKIIE